MSIATKEQERKALEKIRNIVKELGEDSYIGTAFEGCFEIAESNIDNDFACSMKQRAEVAEEDYKKVKELFEAVSTTAGKMQTILEAADDVKDSHADWSRESKGTTEAVFNYYIGHMQDKIIEADTKVIENLRRTNSEEFEKAADAHYYYTDKKDAAIQARDSLLDMSRLINNMVGLIKTYFED